MRPTASQYAEALSVLSKEGMSAPDLAQNFLGFLKRRGESVKASTILQQLEKRERIESGRLVVTVVTAHALQAETKTVLLKQAEQIFPDRLLLLRYEVDEAVIGGVRFYTDETLYDATLATKLVALKNIIQ